MGKDKFCACCGERTLSADSRFEICPRCGWEDDDIQNDAPNWAGGANMLSLNQYKTAWSVGRASRPHFVGEPALAT
ncbi:hypothetical protein FACS1894139_01270 [Planctomycetales bacterium]|nr:hypothetical protein FACS1894107_03980 [Planctomycetales bacterium]GHT02661.1 hypothetical protein FACS1894139_01270 [Planctomycetales bacterium]GHV24122.1 hypothetical protein AGMMS49959_19230 [Planctomycetales bacterium]